MAASRWFGRGLRVVRGAFDGFWLGVLTDAELDAIDTRYYDDRGSYRDADYNEQGLFAWETKVVEEHFGGCQRVVVTAAGGGREVLALRERGVEADGFECNATLAAAGRALLESRGYSDAVRRCARDEWPTTEAYDGAIAGWGSYMLIRGRRRRVAFLRGAARSLPSGSPLLVSFFSRSSIGPDLRLTAALGNVIRGLTRRERLEAGDALAPNFVHLFTQDGIREELKEGGFELLSFSRGPYPHAVARRF
jgi:hypothetical protein